MLVVLELVRLSLWLLFLQIFNVLRKCCWVLNGTYRELSKSGTAYKKSVHAKRILLRYTFDEINFPFTETRFLSIHDGFVDPDFLLRDDVTLVNIDHDSALFVQSTRDVLDPASGCFVHIAQFRHAVSLLVVPMASLLQLAESLPDPSRLVCIGNITRCGSTLLGHVFSAGANCRVWTEPKVCHGLYALRGKLESSRYHNVLRSVLKLMCKPAQSIPAPTAYVIKFGSVAFDMFPSIHQILPQTTFLFLYREILPAIKSFNRTLWTSNTLSVVGFVILNVPVLAKFVMRTLAGWPYESDISKGKMKSYSEMSTFIIGSIIAIYLKQRNDLPIYAAKYDDIMSDPIGQLQLIMTRAGISLDVEKTKAVLKKDSQANSALSWENVKHREGEDVSAEIRPRVNIVWSILGLSEFEMDNLRLPGTVTTRVV